MPHPFLGRGLGASGRWEWHADQTNSVVFGSVAIGERRRSSSVPQVSDKSGVIRRDSGVCY